MVLFVSKLEIFYIYIYCVTKWERLPSNVYTAESGATLGISSYQTPQQLECRSTSE